MRLAPEQPRRGPTAAMPMNQSQMASAGRPRSAAICIGTLCRCGFTFSTASDRGTARRAAAPCSGRRRSAGAPRSSRALVQHRDPIAARRVVQIEHRVEAAGDLRRREHEEQRARRPAGSASSRKSFSTKSSAATAQTPTHALRVNVSTMATASAGMTIAGHVPFARRRRAAARRPRRSPASAGPSRSCSGRACPAGAGRGCRS